MLNACQTFATGSLTSITRMTQHINVKLETDDYASTFNNDHFWSKFQNKTKLRQSTWQLFFLCDVEVRD